MGDMEWGREGRHGRGDREEAGKGDVDGRYGVG